MEPRLITDRKPAYDMNLAKVTVQYSADTFGLIKHWLSASTLGIIPTSMLCQRNELWIVVPCHCVIGSSGKLTGYAGGLAIKEWLLTPKINKYYFLWIYKLPKSTYILVI
ncbi:MAG: methylated-DNA--[protein]-cysteine S-methyltransferase [Chitinophagales bacterium]|jgi:hypothetical protein|nr:methylated-DNA--[protein]-cysteine S-methyltransferase [Chitinophagales bacterium]